MLSTIQKVYESYGFEPIEQPFIEAAGYVYGLEAEYEALGRGSDSEEQRKIVHRDGFSVACFTIIAMMFRSTNGVRPASE